MYKFQAAISINNSFALSWDQASPVGVRIRQSTIGTCTRGCRILYIASFHWRPQEVAARLSVWKPAALLKMVLAVRLLVHALKPVC